MGVCRILSSLLHHDVKGTKVLQININRRLWHVLIDDLAEDRDVSGRVAPYSLNKRVFSVEEFTDVLQLNFDDIGLLVCNLLQLGHVLELSMDGVFFTARN